LCYKYYRALGDRSSTVFFWQELQLKALSPLPKAIVVVLVARQNVVRSGSKARPKTLPKGAASDGSCCPTGPNNVRFV